MIIANSLVHKYYCLKELDPSYACELQGVIYLVTINRKQSSC